MVVKYYPKDLYSKISYNLNLNKEYGVQSIAMETLECKHFFGIHSD